MRQALELCRGAGGRPYDTVAAPAGGALTAAGKCEVVYTVSELPAVLARLVLRLYR